jgi:Zn-finger protein
VYARRAKKQGKAIARMIQSRILLSVMQSDKKADCSYFSNAECEFFPCHGIAGQNCLFCYCPLYPFECGGDFRMIGSVKDCSPCAIVHKPGGYEYVQKRLKERYGQ